MQAQTPCWPRCFSWNRAPSSMTNTTVQNALLVRFHVFFKTQQVHLVDASWKSWHPNKNTASAMVSQNSPFFSYVTTCSLCTHSRKVSMPSRGVHRAILQKDCTFSQLPWKKSPPQKNIWEISLALLSCTTVTETQGHSNVKKNNRQCTTHGQWKNNFVCI